MIAATSFPLQDATGGSTFGSTSIRGRSPSSDGSSAGRRMRMAILHRAREAARTSTVALGPADQAEIATLVRIDRPSSRHFESSPGMIGPRGG